MSRISWIALLSIGFIGHALAQSGSLSDTDKAYLMKESRGAAYELNSAKLAVKQASRDDVKSYAAKLVNDHEKYNAALEQIGKQEGLTLPTEPDTADKARMDDLKRLTGTAFDALYVKEALRINADDKQDTTKEKSETKSEPIKAFIAKFAGMDAEHEKLAKQLEKSNS